MHIKAAVDGGDVWAATVQETHWTAARQMARRKAAGYVGIKHYDGSVLLVAGVPLTGRGWRLRAMSLERLGAEMKRERVRRVDWSETWRPAPTERGSVVSRVCFDKDLAEEVLQRMGYDRVTERIPGLEPGEVAERFEEVADAVSAEREKALERKGKARAEGRDSAGGKSLVRGSRVRAREELQ